MLIQDNRFLEPFSDLFDWRVWLLPVGLAFFLIFVSFHNYLLFHTAAEFFAVVIGVLVCVVAWQTYPFSRNSFLMYLGCGYFWIAVLDGVHTLVYKGMTVYPITVANPTAQFWIATRYSEALLLLTAPFFLNRAVAKSGTLLGFGLVAVVLYALIMTGYFPDAFIEGQGLTSFKVASEYVIITLLAAALVFLARRRALVGMRVFALLTFSIILTMIAELAFTFYVSVYGLSNLVGHIFKFFSFWLIFQAVVISNLKFPYAALRESEERLRAVFDNTPICLTLKDNEGRYLLINKPYEVWTDRSAGDIIGKKACEVQPHKAEVENLTDAERRVLETGEAFEREVSVSRPDGRTFNWILIEFPVKSADGLVAAIGTAAIDITERKLPRKL